MIWARLISVGILGLRTLLDLLVVPLIPALRRQRLVDVCELEARLFYRLSFRTARATQRNLVVRVYAVRFHWRGLNFPF